MGKNGKEVTGGGEGYGFNNSFFGVKLGEVAMYHGFDI